MEWKKEYKEYKTLHFYVFWAIWRSINALIFENIPLDTIRMCVNIGAYFNEIGLAVNRRKQRSIQQLENQNIYLVGFFDGAANSSKCGGGAYIVLELGQYYYFYWNNGFGTDSQVEIIALWGILFCAKWL